MASGVTPAPVADRAPACPPGRSLCRGRVPGSPGADAVDAFLPGGQAQVKAHRFLACGQAQLRMQGNPWRKPMEQRPAMRVGLRTPGWIPTKAHPVQHQGMRGHQTGSLGAELQARTGNRLTFPVDHLATQACRGGEGELQDLLDALVTWAGPDVARRIARRTHHAIGHSQSFGVIEHQAGGITFQDSASQGRRRNPTAAGVTHADFGGRQDLASCGIVHPDPTAHARISSGLRLQCLSRKGTTQEHQDGSAHQDQGAGGHSRPTRWWLPGSGPVDRCRQFFRPARNLGTAPAKPRVRGSSIGLGCLRRAILRCPCRRRSRRRTGRRRAIPASPAPLR